MDIKECHVKGVSEDQRVWLDAEFLGVFQRSIVKQALLIGEVGGTIASPVAVVNLNGKLIEMELCDVKLKEPVKLWKKK